MKILILDDEVDIGMVLALEFKIKGHNAFSFSSVSEAQNFILQNPDVDAIVCDFQMPKMNGLEFFKWCRSQNYTNVFYILTGEPSMDVQKIISEGITDVLFKPQDLNKLSQLFK